MAHSGGLISSFFLLFLAVWEVKKNSKLLWEDSSIIKKVLPALIFYFVRLSPLPSLLLVSQARLLNILLHSFLCFFTPCSNDKNHFNFLFSKCYVINTVIKLYIERFIRTLKKVCIILSVLQLGINWGSGMSHYLWSRLEWGLELRFDIKSIWF